MVLNASVRPVRRAVIVAVGSELLTPHKVDTNSLFLTERLNTEGVVVQYKAVVGDDPAQLADLVREAIPRADLIVLTGGLGATADDVTRDTIAALFKLDLEEDAGVVAHIRKRFETRGMEMPEINRRQALVPRGAVVLRNPRGTAPGLLLDRDDVTCVLLPGPPRELRPMFEEVCAVHLGARCTGTRIYRQVLTIAGRTETYVEELTQPLYSQWLAREPVVTTTVLSTLGQIELHLATQGVEPSVAESVLAQATGELSLVLGRSVVSVDGASLEETVGRLLRRAGQRVAVAESCTGGLIASRLTDVPGSSSYLEAAWVTYGNDAKVRNLGVDPALLASHGAVSEEVAESMAVHAKRLAIADYGIGVTGIAGPGGGTEEKPVGTVCVALAGPEGAVRVRTFRFPGERDRVKFQASQVALDMLRRALLPRA